MNHNSWRDELLDDVLGEGATPSFQAESLDQLLGAAAKRRVGRKRSRRLAAAAGLVVVIGVATWLLEARKGTTANESDGFIVHSALPYPQLVITTMPETVSKITVSYPIALVEPIPARQLFERIDDGQLLALLGGRPAALIHLNNSFAEIVFIDPSTANGFQVR